MDNLAKRQRAAEAEWALKAQEEQVMSYRERLLRSADGKQRLARAAAGPQLQASSMLPQIAAHYVRVEGQQKVRMRPRSSRPRGETEHQTCARPLRRLKSDV